MRLPLDLKKSKQHPKKDNKSNYSETNPSRQVGIVCTVAIFFQQAGLIGFILLIKSMLNIARSYTKQPMMLNDVYSRFPIFDALP